MLWVYLQEHCRMDHGFTLPHQVYLLAVDEPGNRQFNTTVLPAVRTTDSVPPVALAFTTSASPPSNMFIISVNSTKPGE